MYYVPYNVIIVMYDTMRCLPVVLLHALEHPGPARQVEEQAAQRLGALVLH